MTDFSPVGACGRSLRGRDPHPNHRGPVRNGSVPGTGGRGGRPLAGGDGSTFASREPSSSRRFVSSAACTQDLGQPEEVVPRDASPGGCLFYDPIPACVPNPKEALKSRKCS